MSSSSYAQQLISRVGGLSHALEFALRNIAVNSGDEARAAIESLRDKAIDAFRNSDIQADREMEHAQMAGPAIDAIKTVFDAVLRDLRD